MKRRIGLGLLLVLVAACSGGATHHADPVVERGDRQLGFDLLDLTASGSFEDNLDQAARCGADFISLHLTWSQIEASPGVLADPGGSLAALNAVCAAEGLRLSLTIRPIDLTGKTVPSDLTAIRFNDAQMANRFAAVIDFVLGIVPSERLLSLQIGNEIDGFDASTEHVDFWSDYGAFLFACTQHVHTAAPGLRTGFTCTLDGLVSGPLADSGIFPALVTTVDRLGITYYPLTEDFTVRGSAGVAADFAALLARYPSVPILVQEVGYPSSATCASSLQQQAAFFGEVFKVWDAHASQIESMNIVRLNDVSPAKAIELAGPYGIAVPAFLAYLESLGLHEADGGDKPAFTRVVAEALARGWMAGSN